MIPLKEPLPDYTRASPGPWSSIYDAKKPADLVRFQEDCDRQRGRTTNMIMALPRDGKCAIMVHSPDMRKHIKRMIYDLRGVDFPIVETRFAVWDPTTPFEEMRGQLRGFNGPIYIDHVVLYMMNHQLVKGLNSHI